MIYFLKFFFVGSASALLFPPFFLLPLGFIIFPYIFLLIIDNKLINKKKFLHFLYGVSYGVGLNIIFFIWINQPFMIDEKTQKISYVSYLLVLYVGIYYGFGFYILSFIKNNFSKLLLFPILFVLLEMARENLFFGFPWLTFSLVTSSNLFFLNLNYYIGTYGMSLFILSVFLLPITIIFLIRKMHTTYSIIYFLFFLTLIIFFIFLLINRFNNIPDHKVNEFNISINQLNVSQENKINRNKYIERYDLIENRIISNRSDLIIFAENDFPGLLSENSLNKMKKLIRNNQVIIIGGVRKYKKEYYNSIYYIGNDYYSHFDKKILVPFGEFLPFRSMLNFLHPISGTIDFNRGTTKRLMGKILNFNFIPIICYEIIFFNDLIRDYNKNVPVLINLTNDAWFGEFSGPYQHFYHARMRSTEFNKFLIRVSNNGISAIIDNYGKIIDFIPLNTVGHKSIKIKIPSQINNYLIYHKLIYAYILFMLLIMIYLNKKKI